MRLKILLDSAGRILIEALQSDQHPLDTDRIEVRACGVLGAHQISLAFLTTRVALEKQ